MRSERGGTKKLILAFHFQFADQAGWKCEDCRRAGLEAKRGCAFWEEAGGRADRVVWARRGVATQQCPKSVITGESLALLEAFCAWKLAGMTDFRELTAREGEAFWLLERELSKELARRGDE